MDPREEMARKLMGYDQQDGAWKNSAKKGRAYSAYPAMDATSGLLNVIAGGGMAAGGAMLGGPGYALAGVGGIAAGHGLDEINRNMALKRVQNPSPLLGQEDFDRLMQLHGKDRSYGDFTY